MEVRHWGKPNPKQEKFLCGKARFTAYGGARGGGKSWAVRVKAALLCLRRAGIRVLILRRSYPELLQNHIEPLMPMLGGIAEYNDTKKAFSFPNGAKLRIGYCAGDKDLLQYQGQEYDVIFIDEATQFTEHQFRVLASCLRGVNRHPKRMYLTCNPGGIGHEWVKRLFVDRDYRNGEQGEDYLFIPATVYDNTALTESGGEYVKFLENLPDGLREAWLHGDWDLFDGRYFSEFDRKAHVMKPFVIPGGWERYFAMDYGLDMLAGYWIAVDFWGNAYVYRELYESGLIISDAARRIREMTDEREITYIAPPDLWNRRQDTGRAASEIFAEHGIPLIRAGNDRVQGWYELREWLKPVRREDGETAPRLRIFDNCIHLIRSVPALQYDEKNPNDCAVSPHEVTHAPDAIRYFAASRPEAARRIPDGGGDFRSEERQIGDFLRWGK